MHSYRASGGTIFNYNSDFSGEVVVTVPYYAVERAIEDGFHVKVPGEDLLEFVAYCYTATKKVSQIENAAWWELLG